MIKKYISMALAAVSLVACAPEYDTDKLPIVIEELSFEGSGTLIGLDGAKTTHKYSYSMTEKSLDFEFEVSLDFAKNEQDGAWVVGYFVLPSNTLFEAIGGEVDLSDFSVFYPIGSDKWTTYKPGMWVGANGEAQDWSAGHVYWFYQNFGDYKENEGLDVKDAFCAGINPDNAIAGETIVSKSLLNGIPFNVTIKLVD